MPLSGKIPTGPGVGKLFLRSKFLDGTYRAFWGSGQDYRAIDTYVPPTDWPAAGTLLRVPRVVWLSCLIPPRIQLNRVPIIGTVSVRTEDPFVGTQDWDGGWAGEWPKHTPGELEAIDWWYMEFREDDTFTETGSVDSTELYNGDDDEFFDERVRLKGVFDAVKATVEAADPATKVHVEPWSNPEAGDDWRFADGFYPHLLAPSVTPPFFGTDWLHIYVGPIVHDRILVSDFGGDLTADSIEVRDYYVTNRTLEDDHETAQEAVRSVYSKFTRMRVVLYGFDGTVGSVISSAGGNDLLAAEAFNLADYGYSYGGLSLDLTASSLSALIAAHYGITL